MVNCALPAAELGAFVDALARRIAAFPAHAVAAAKQVGQYEGPILSALDREAQAYSQTALHPDAHAAMRRFLATSGQTRESERGDPFAVLADIKSRKSN